MAKKAEQKELQSIADLDPQVIAAVVLADLAQIEADTDTHPDPVARGRILTALSRLRSIAQGDISVETIEGMA